MKKIFKLIQLLVITFLFSFILLFVYAYISEKPDIGNSHYIKLYDDSYNLIYNSSHVNHEIKLEDISPYFVESLIAIEDHRFYKHHGFDLIGILRAVVKNIKEQSFSEGASTITQQNER